VAAFAITPLYKNIFGDAPINAMLLAGSALVLAALANLLITNRKVMTYVPEGEA